jgi:ABC-type dipeptide/oligopeptide/nickel transport system permease subunit
MIVRSRNGIVTIVVLLWLLIGVVAGFQRGYFGSSDPSCSRLATIAGTVFAGPLNYVGVNPRIGCSAPQPSQ